MKPKNINDYILKNYLNGISLTDILASFVLSEDTGYQEFTPHEVILNKHGWKKRRRKKRKHYELEHEVSKTVEFAHKKFHGHRIKITENSNGSVSWEHTDASGNTAVGNDYKELDAHLQNYMSNPSN